MTSVEDIATEISECGLLFANRAPGAGSDRLRDSMAASLAAKVGRISRFDAGAAIKIRDSIAAADGLPPAISSSIQGAVDDRLVADSDCSQHADGKDRVVPQLLTHIDAFLSNKDWQQMDNHRNSPQQLMGVMQNRLNALGVQSLNEFTVRACVSLLLKQLYDRTGTWPTYRKIYDFVLDFKGSLLACLLYHIEVRSPGKHI